MLGLTVILIINDHVFKPQILQQQLQRDDRIFGRLYRYCPPDGIKVFPGQIGDAGPVKFKLLQMGDDQLRLILALENNLIAIYPA